MRSSTFLCLAILATFLVSEPLEGQERARQLLEKISIKRNVEYRRAGLRALHVDVYRPKSPAVEKLPVVVWIHGGGWQGGNKLGGTGRLATLAATGKYAGVAVEYRLTDTAQWPEQIYDCKAAIRWIRANADEYGFDAEKIGVWGASAGGHLVSMLGTSGDVPQLEGDGPYADQSSRVTCVVDFCGPSNFSLFATPRGASRRAESPITKLLGGPLDEKAEVAKQASPVTYVSADDPPFLIVHGTDDKVVPISQAESLHEKLQQAEVDVTFVKIVGGGHGIGGSEVTTRVDQFFAKHLLGEQIEVSAEPIGEK
jgi:acetyl esterase/lipase